MKHTREDIAAEVIAVLTEVRGVKVTTTPLRLDSHLIKDLHLSSDDATDACLSMQKRTGIKPPVKVWGTVGTIEDAIELLLKYADPQRTVK